MKKSVDELKETMKSDKKELKDKVFMACSKLEHGIEGTFMFLQIVFLQIENEYTDIKRRVELETNEIRDKQQVRRSYI